MNTFDSFRHYFTPHHTNNQRPKLLHPSSLALVIGFVLVVQFLLRQTTVYYPEILGYSAQIPVDDIISLTNSQRRTRNIPELRLDPLLSKAAAQKAADMFAKGYWAHVSPDGVQPWAFFTSAGYSYRYAGENLARDFSSAPSVVDAWMASPGHKDNLLSNRYQDIGVAVVDGQLGGRDTTLVVQLFGTKLSSQSKGSVTKNFRVSSATVPRVRAETTQSTDLPISTQIDSSTPSLSQYEVNRNIAIILLMVFGFAIVLDLVIVYRKSVVRWTSKSLAHLVFIGCMILAIFSVLQGQLN